MVQPTTHWTHLQRVCRLYKVVLRLHRGLPTDIKILGDVYVKDEFRRHKNCKPTEANVFLNEWAVSSSSLCKLLKNFKACCKHYLF